LALMPKAGGAKAFANLLRVHAARIRAGDPGGWHLSRRVRQAVREALQAGS
jgi:hypothetical protein